MKAVLIDDEYYALQRLKMMLEELGGIEIAGMFTEGSEALDQIADLQPDVVFLDIEMPNKKGIELFSIITSLSKQTRIIFVTAYEQYAVEAFQLDALDYIVKPVQEERLKKTMERLNNRLYTNQSLIRKRLAFRCFGKLSVLIDGKEANITGLRKKSEELLAYLLCYKGNFVAKEKIMNDLWGDMDSEKAANNLYVSFYNLKRHEVLGNLLPLESVRGKMRICLDETSLDLIEFEERVEKCGKVGEGTIHLALEALELQSSMLLETNYYRWTHEEQARYDIIYSELMEKVIDYYQLQGNQKRIEYFREMINCRLV